MGCKSGRTQVLAWSAAGLNGTKKTLREAFWSLPIVARTRIPHWKQCRSKPSVYMKGCYSRPSLICGSLSQWSLNWTALPITYPWKLCRIQVAGILARNFPLFTRRAVTLKAMLLGGARQLTDELPFLFWMRPAPPIQDICPDLMIRKKQLLNFFLVRPSPIPQP